MSREDKDNYAELQAWASDTAVPGQFKCRKCESMNSLENQQRGSCGARAFRLPAATMSVVFLKLLFAGGALAASPQFTVELASSLKENWDVDIGISAGFILIVILDMSFVGSAIRDIVAARSQAHLLGMRASGVRLIRESSDSADMGAMQLIFVLAKALRFSRTQDERDENFFFTERGQPDCEEGAKIPRSDFSRSTRKATGHAVS